MKIAAVVLSLGLVLLGACILNASPTSMDLDRRDRLASQFEGQYEFMFEDVYLRGQALLGAPTRKDALRIVEAFWFDNGSFRTDSKVVYLNLYDDRGEFAFQAYWDKGTQQVALSTAEHY